METNIVMTRWVKNFRFLIFALIISGSINIGFIAAFVFSVLQERQTSLSVTLPAKVEGKQETTMQKTLAQMSKLSFHELVPFLTNRDPVEEGYLKRDLAVAALYSSHQFHLVGGKFLGGEGLRNDDAIGQVERFGKRDLKGIPPTRGGARLENRPELA